MWHPRDLVIIRVDEMYIHLFTISSYFWDNFHINVTICLQLRRVAHEAKWIIGAPPTTVFMCHDFTKKTSRDMSSRQFMYRHGGKPPQITTHANPLCSCEVANKKNISGNTSIHAKRCSHIYERTRFVHNFLVMWWVWICRVYWANFTYSK